jgi:tetratricopeptide (TPR) repeat protein
MKGIEYFQKAVDADPTYALSYVGLADCYNVLGSWESGAMSPSEAVPKAIRAARKALEVDDRLGEAHASLGYAKQHYEWDWVGAQLEFKRANDLNPNYTNTHHWASHLYMAMGQIPESLNESRKALEIDPLDFYLNVHLGWHYVFAREPDLAIDQYRAAHELDPHNFGSHYFLAWAYVEKGDLTRATAEAVEAATLLNNAPVVLSSVGYMYAISGKQAAAEDIIQNLLAIRKQHYVSPYEIGVIYVGLGKFDRAFEWFDQAVQQRSGWLSYLDVEPRLDVLRHDARFAELRRRVGLPAQLPAR